MEGDLFFWFSACPVLLCRADVGDLAMQCAVVFGDEQPSVTGTMADGVGGQFMHGKHDVTGAALGHAGLGGVGGDGCPQRIQRSRVETLIQYRRDLAASVRLGRWFLLVGIMGHGQPPG